VPFNVIYSFQEEFFSTQLFIQTDNVLGTNSRFKSDYVSYNDWTA